MATSANGRLSHRGWRTLGPPRGGRGGNWSVASPRFFFSPTLSLRSHLRSRRQQDAARGRRLRLVHFHHDPGADGFDLLVLCVGRKGREGGEGGRCMQPGRAAAAAAGVAGQFSTLSSPSCAHISRHGRGRHHLQAAARGRAACGHQAAGGGGEGGLHGRGRGREKKGERGSGTDSGKKGLEQHTQPRLARPPRVSPENENGPRCVCARTPPHFPHFTTGSPPARPRSAAPSRPRWRPAPKAAARPARPGRPPGGANGRPTLSPSRPCR